MTEETVIITKQELYRLETDSLWLCCLEMAGVDSWQKIDEAMRMFKLLQPKD